MERIWNTSSVFLRHCSPQLNWQESMINFGIETYWQAPQVLVSQFPSWWKCTYSECNPKQVYSEVMPSDLSGTFYPPTLWRRTGMQSWWLLPACCLRQKHWNLAKGCRRSYPVRNKSLFASWWPWLQSRASGSRETLVSPCSVVSSYPLLLTIMLWLILTSLLGEQLEGFVSVLSVSLLLLLYHFEL